MSERESMFPDVPRYDRWTHRGDVQGLVSTALATAMRHPYRDLVVTVRKPTEADGCWCLRDFERPHPHKPSLGGCPPSIAWDNYVRLTIEQRCDVDSREDELCAECGLRVGSFANTCARTDCPEWRGE